MCNAAVNAFWSSARIDAEKKKKFKMRLRPPLQFTNFFNDTVYQIEESLTQLQVNFFGRDVKFCQVSHKM